MDIPQPYTINSKIKTIRTMSCVEPNIRVLLTQPRKKENTSSTISKILCWLLMEITGGK